MELRKDMVAQSGLKNYLMLSNIQNSLQKSSTHGEQVEWEKLNVFLRINHIHNLISKSIFFGDKLVRLLNLKSSPVRKLNSKNLSFRCEPISRCKKYILQLNQYEEHSCSHLVYHGWKALTYS